MQGMAAIMPAIVIVGLAKTITTLYVGLTLFAFGMFFLIFINVVVLI